MRGSGKHREGRPVAWWSAVAFTIGLLLLIVVAVGGAAAELSFGTVISVGTLVLVMHRLIPASGLFSVMLANAISVYVVLFLFFRSVNFPSVAGKVALFGFELPLFALLGGIIWKRESIRALVRDHTEEPAGDAALVRGLWWLVPVALIGIATFGLSPFEFSKGALDVIFLLAMLGISLVVLFASQDVAMFLLDTGLLFQDFFDRASSLVRPAFAFLSVYSLTVIVFGCIYRIFDLYTVVPCFSAGGSAHHLSFLDALYFSIVTLSTVGYGDITPLCSGVRVIAAAQIVVGILVVMFALQAILSYVRR